MKNQYFGWLAIRILFFSVLCATAAHAGILPLPDSVPDGLPERFRQERTNLVDKAAILEDRIISHDAKCSNVASNSTEARKCAEENPQIQAAAVVYLNEMDAFNQSMKQAQNKLNKDAAHLATALDLAKDPQLVEAARLRLKQINSRLGRLQKAIDILSDSNPEWQKEWANLHHDQIEQTHELMWNGLDLLTFGLAAGAEKATKIELEKVQDIFEGEGLSDLMRRKESLLKMREAFNNKEAFDKYISNLTLLEKAVRYKGTAEAVAKLRDAVSSGLDTYKETKKSVVNRDATEMLYQGSLSMAGIGVSLVGGIGGKVAAPVAIGFKAVEAGLRVKLIYEEEQQFKNLSSQSYDRSQKKLELMKTKEELENQAIDLEMVLHRSEGFR